MTSISIGDLAQGYVLRRQNADLKEQMGLLVRELSSGRTADVSRHLSGSYAFLADVERNLGMLETYAAAASEAALFPNGMQDALEVFQAFATNLGSSALSSVASALPEAVANTSHQAAGDFTRMISALNTGVAGRSLFSGVATDTSPLATGPEILNALRTAVTGETTAAGVQAVLDDWFDTPGGGFDTMAYKGASQSLSPFSVARGEAVDLDLRADNGAVRALLKHAATAALAADSSLGLDVGTQAELLTSAGEGLAFGQAGLTEIRADLGYAQSRIEDSETRISSERIGYQIAQADLLAVDPFETATELENVQFQLESLYAVTVRMSRLSLVDFLR